MERAFVRVRDGQVHYVRAGSGSGPPLVLLHETPRSWRSFARVIPFLAERHRVFALDTLGFGDSDPAPESFTTIADYARNVVDVLDALEIERAHIVGDHTGAMIGVEMAVAAPGRVAKLVLSGLPFFRSREERLEQYELAAAYDRELPAADGSHLIRIWQRLLRTRIPGSERGELDAEELALMSELMLDTLKAGPMFRRMRLLVYETDLSARFGLIRAPSLSVSVRGEGTPPFTRRAAELAACIPRCEVRLFEGVDGRINHTHPHVFAEVIGSFLLGS